MSMKKSDVVDRTIRMVGDVTSISTSDTAKSGVDSPITDVPAPPLDGVTAPTGGTGAQYIPSLDGLPQGKGGDGSGLVQPDEGMAPEADSVQTSKNGQGVSWPAGADTTSAGGAKSVGSGGTLVLKTGGAVKFPESANNSAPVKMVESFGD